MDKAAVELAIHEIAAHPRVVDLQAPVFAGGRAHVTFGLDLKFGSRWDAEGQSPTGVKSVEPVRLDFLATFPSSAARPSLRADFSRNHPHIQPWLGAEGRVVPCVVDGSIDEFAAARGHYRLIEQLVGWLESAAEGRLIDPKQGWEPMRRDGVDSMLTCDAAALRVLVTAAGGYAFLSSTYMWKRPNPQQAGFYFGQADGPSTLKDAVIESPADSDGWGYGLGVTLAVWAGRAPEGGPAVCDAYLPETVTNLEGLLARAKILRMDEPLRAGLGLIQRKGRFDAAATPFPVPVVLLVRRPYNLIGSDSAIELCSYLVPVTPAKGGDQNPAVEPLGQYEAISPALLRRMSGTEAGEPWVLLGCGSLGSKIAAHQARAGSAPNVVADRAALRAHNAARHALFPRKRIIQLDWGGPKPIALQRALEGLGQDVKGLEGTHRDLLAALRAQNALAVSWLVNTTASTVVREDLARETAQTPRVVEAMLFDRGRLGYLSREGRDRNPNTAEMLGELYELGRARPEIGKPLFHPDGDQGAITIGQGCSSNTLVVSDAQISALAAPMSELIGDLAEAKPEGQIDLFQREGLSLKHEAVTVAPYRRVPLQGLDGWSVNVSQRAFDALLVDVAAHPRTETGGVLMGWVSLLARQIYVTSLLPSPPDSTRGPSEFTLGTQGLTAAFSAIAADTAEAIVCVGTWHSHPGKSTPSAKDRASALKVGALEPRPKAFLIYGTDGLQAVIAATPTALLAGKP